MGRPGRSSAPPLRRLTTWPPRNTTSGAFSVDPSRTALGSPRTHEQAQGATQVAPPPCIELLGLLSASLEQPPSGGWYSRRGLKSRRVVLGRGWVRRLQGAASPPAGGAAGGAAGVVGGRASGRLTGCTSRVDTGVEPGHIVNVGSGNADHPGGLAPRWGLRVPLFGA